MSILDLAEADYARKMAEQHCAFLRHNAHADAMIKKTNPAYEPPECEEMGALDGMNIISNSVMGDDAIQKILKAKQSPTPDDGIDFVDNGPNDDDRESARSTTPNSKKEMPLWARGLLLAGLGASGAGLGGLGTYYAMKQPTPVDVTVEQPSANNSQSVVPIPQPPPQYIWEFTE